MDASVWVLTTLFLSHVFEVGVTQKNTEYSTSTRDNESLIDLFGNQTLTDYENPTTPGVDIVSTVPTGVVGTTHTVPTGVVGTTYTVPTGVVGTTHTVPTGVVGTTHTVPTGVVGTTYTVPTGVVGTTYTVPTGVVDTTHTVPTGVVGTTYTVPIGVEGTTNTVPTGVVGTTHTVPTGVVDTTDTVPTGVVDTTNTVPTGVVGTTNTVPTGVLDTPHGRDVSTQSTTESEPRTTAPRQVTIPLPLSGSLPSPVTDVSKICPCDHLKDQCDPNCCCDPECSEELVLFTSCTVETVSGEPRLCSQDVATYSISETVDGYAQVRTSVQKQVNQDVLCIHSTNYEASLSLATPEVPTVGNFDGLYQRFLQFWFGSSSDGATLPTGEPLNSSRYLYGDVIETEEESGQSFYFRFPTPSVTTECTHLNPAAFLRDQSSRCTQKLVLERDCTTLKALSVQSYTYLRLRSMKSKDASVVTVEVVSVLLQSLEGTQTRLNLTGNLSMDPLLLANQAPNSAVCINVVLQVAYKVTYSEAGDIVRVTAAVVLGAIDRSTVPVEQQFEIKFIQENVEEVVLGSSGNPGYVVGLPLLAGTKTADGIVRISDSRGTLNLLHGSKTSDCLGGPHQRSPVLFGVNMMSGCTLSLDDTANCSVVSELLLGVLRGQGFPQYVASFGNSLPQKPNDWVLIRNQTKPMEVQSCSIPLSLHLEVQWTQYGSLVNPQAQIISVTEAIQTNSSNLASLSGGSRTISVTTSVTFIPMSAAAQPGYKALPTIQAKLPYDFFFPFV